MPRLSRPKIIYLEKCRAIGSSSDKVPTIVCEGKREALLISEPHHRLKNGQWSGGGPLFVHKSYLTHGSMAKLTYRWGGVDVVHTLWGHGFAPKRPSFPPLSGNWVDKQQVLKGLYATGYSKARPGNPVASLGQFIVELRDLPAMPFKRAIRGGFSSHFSQIPKLLHKELSDFKNLGSEYLNVVFGWKPFVSDVRKMYHLWYDIDKRMAQIIRENGKYIRRRAKILDETETIVTYPAQKQGAFFGVNAQPPNIWGSDDNYVPRGVSTFSQVRTVKRKAWFSGSFRYYIPDTSSSLWDARARAALFGALPTPELLWEVLPWSWLIDWFSNIGDVISNASPNAVDNLTTRYSFVMESVTTVDEWKTTTSVKAGSNGNDRWPSHNSIISSNLKVETKSRLGGGNPFGLNVKLSALSGHQLGILAALGLSRSSVR